MTKRAGYVALLGRPNVGKSTLLNRFLRQKISITSPKPQTTRHAILGIQTLTDTQTIYVDTPGVHLNAQRAINRYMNRTACDVLSYVNVAVFLVEALRWTSEDDEVLNRLSAFQGPILLVVNKVDRATPKEKLLPFIERLSKRSAFTEVVPISAKTGHNVDALEGVISTLLPESEFFFAEDQITTASQRFMAAELVREKLTRCLRQELPYALTVDIETFAEQGSLLHIGAIIWVERPGQKAIIIGNKGATLKEVGRQAREDMEKQFGCKVFLETWVKVREGWSNNENALHSFGYS
jgi:GTP-binding protein Era